MSAHSRRAMRIRLFRTEYIKNGGNGKEAAIAAGFPPRSASVRASEILRDPRFQRSLLAKQQELLARSELSAERTLKEVARIAYFNPKDLYDESGELLPIPELHDDVAAVISGMDIETTYGKDDTKTVKTKIKLCDKDGALDKAMKNQGLYEEDNNQKPREPANITDLARKLMFALELGARAPVVIEQEATE